MISPQRLRCPYSRKFEFKVSAWYTYIIITFDVLDRFQENTFQQTAQTMNNILKLKENGSFVTIELEVQKNACLALMIQILQLKQNFSAKDQHTLMPTTCYNSTQSYLGIHLILTTCSMFEFCIENHEVIIVRKVIQKFI